MTLKEMNDKNPAIAYAWVLRELAEEIETYHCYGVRIGLTLLSFVGNEYEVVDWDGNKTRFCDLSDAIVKFINVQTA